MTNIKGPAWTRENVQFIGLLLLSVGAVYFTPVIISQIFFGIILFLVYRSKKDYFWIAFLFILLDAPGRLFSGFSGGDTGLGYASYIKSLPYFPVGGFKLSFYDAFFLIIIIKTVLSRRPNNFIFKNDSRFLLLYFILVLAYSFLVYSITPTNVTYSIRKIVPWILLSFIPTRYSFDDFIKFDRLIFPFVFFAFASQIFTFITGHYLIDIFTQSVSVRADALEWSEEGGYRAGDSAFVLFYCLHKGLFYFFNPEKKFASKYTTMIILFSVLSIFITATRGWIVAVFAVLILAMYHNSTSYNIKRVVILLLSGIMFLFILLIVFPGFDNQASYVVDRVFTLSKIAGGDLSAGGTLSRLTDRAPAVLREFYKSPVFGYGFSTTFYAFADIHVGQPTMLLNVGIFGFLIFTYIFFKWLHTLYKLAKTKIMMNTYGNSLLVFAYALIFIYILHSSSQTSWGFYITVEQAVIAMCLLLTSFNAIIHHPTDLINVNKK